MSDTKPQHILERRSAVPRSPLLSGDGVERGVLNFIDESAQLGTGTKVWHFAVILQDVVIGDLCNVGSGAEIGRGTKIGDRSRISSGVFLPPDSVVGSDVFIGPGAIFTDDKFPRTLQAGESYFAEPPVVGDFASIGAGAVILPGVKIGSFARVAAGAIVTDDVGPHEMVRGEPARTRARSEAAKNW